MAIANVIVKHASYTFMKTIENVSVDSSYVMMPIGKVNVDKVHVIMTTETYQLT